MLTTVVAVTMRGLGCLLLGCVVLVLVLLIVLLTVVIKPGPNACKFYHTPSRLWWVEKVRQTILRAENCPRSEQDARLRLSLTRSPKLLSASAGPVVPVYDFNRKGRKYLFGELHGSLLVLRGTVYWNEFLSDLYLYKMTPWPSKPDLRVHHGALRIARSVAAQIGHHRVIHAVYAYSLGAMVGALLLYDQYLRTGVAARARFIGNPPVGNKAFVEAFNLGLPHVSYVNHPRDYIADTLFLPQGAFGYYTCGRRLDAASYPFVWDFWRHLMPHLSYL